MRLPVVHIFLGHQSPTAVAVERQHVRHARRFDARDGPYPPQDLLQDGPAPRQVVAVVEFDLDRRRVLRLKAQVHVQQAHKAAQQQARADQQHARQRHLRHHQRGTHAFVPPARGSFQGRYLSAPPAGSPAETRNAGARPKITATEIAISTVHPSAAPSTRTVESSGSAIWFWRAR